MNDDLGFAKGNGANDAGYDPLYSGFDDVEAAERQEREDALPRGIYLVEFQAGKASFSKDADPRLGRPAPGIRLGAKVIEGVDGTAGRVGFGSLKIYPNPNKYGKSADGKRTASPMNDAEYGKALGEHAAMLKRVAQELGLVRGLPAKPHTEETLTEFGLQFAGKRAVIDISQLPGNEEFDASNLFIWKSIANPDSPVKDKKSGAVVGTALEVARKAIARANAKAAAKKGLTAAESFGGATPSGF